MKGDLTMVLALAGAGLVAWWLYTSGSLSSAFGQTTVAATPVSPAATDSTGLVPAATTATPLAAPGTSAAFCALGPCPKLPATMPAAGLSGYRGLGTNLVRRAA
jgi:hypothetical protein